MKRRKNYNMASGTSLLTIMAVLLGSATVLAAPIDEEKSLDAVMKETQVNVLIIDKTPEALKDEKEDKIHKKDQAKDDAALKDQAKDDAALKDQAKDDAAPKDQVKDDAPPKKQAKDAVPWDETKADAVPWDETKADAAPWDEAEDERHQARYEENKQILASEEQEDEKAPQEVVNEEYDQLLKEDDGDDDLDEEYAQKLEKRGHAAVSALSSSVYLNNKINWGPQLAMRGRSRSSVGFFHSKLQNRPWLRIQIPVTKISGVGIINRKDCCGNRLRNVQVCAGMSPRLRNRAVGFFKGPGRTGGEYTVNFRHPVVAKYITFQLLLRGYLQINGIKLYGAARPSLRGPYRSVGCWKDKGTRAIATLEGKDRRLNGHYRRRAHAIQKCYQAAKARGYRYFAVQHGGWCASSSTAGRTYRRYGRSNRCRKGKGGPWANDVYMITEPAIPIGKLVNPMVGVWTLKYTNGYKDKIEIKANGKIVIASKPNRNVHLQPSNNPKQFPTSQGWLMATKNYRPGTWEYFRMSNNGKLEIQHFCSDHCRGKYQHVLQNYCCVGTGERSIATGCWYKISPGCIAGRNIIRYRKKTVAECKVLCLANSKCLAFEYGVNHGGRRKIYKTGDCQLNNKNNGGRCDGQLNNFDLYVRIDCDGGLAKDLPTTQKSDTAGKAKQKKDETYNTEI